MKKILGIGLIMLSIIGLTGCEENVPQDDSGNEKKQFNISETATINDTKIKISSIKKNVLWNMMMNVKAIQNLIMHLGVFWEYN